ncbi:fibronectin type III domain-containing protein [Aquimarina sp. ERC-38]|uniref:fibronectin type III domain-containing protein n=1 Tax=Aquimarina sp. ERC-38 TaxID=2949996 RepID=UPI0022464720|nr:fibronectin type III domain-containing protein [Aquimarina sp. ERC-38]UZO79838.1 fibronectin type III domain-containing protein [Aquimarina sp. ERC-38]
MQVRLLLGDLSINRRQIRLKAYFEGNGIAFESVDNVTGAPALFIDGGTPLNLTNAELAPYFELPNLRGISSRVYGRTIPEGSYQFCFEVFDVITGNKLGDKTCATTFIFKNEPPLLNLPLQDAILEPKAVENIVFQWTPRHINVSNVEYELSLVEIWDERVDPRTAFLSSPPVFQTTTRTTSFVYGPAQPPLLNDKRYAWQVQAKAIKGAEEIGLFKNEGKSEIYWFSKTKPCVIPTGVYGEPKGLSRMNIFWDEDPTVYNEYEISYREKGKANARWFSKRTNAGWATVWDLKPNTTYEFKLRGKCKFGYSPYTKTQSITTEAAEDKTANYNCGIVPDAIAITNREGHPNLLIGDRITAGDFMVTITDITSEQDGVISGSGFVRVPYLEQARFGVTFNNILVNTDYQLAKGEIVTLYDPVFGEGEEMIVNLPVTEWLESIGGIINNNRDKVREALTSGAITQEEADELEEQIEEQEQLKEEIEEELTKGDDADKERVREFREKVDGITEQLQKELGAFEGGQNIVNKNDVITNDTYFDGAIKFSIADKTIQFPQKAETPVLNLSELAPSQGNSDATYFNYTTLKGANNKTYYVSKSNLGEALETNEDYKTIKEKMANVASDEYLLWVHYDFKNNETKYKVVFGDQYYNGAITQHELAKLYNNVLSFDLKGAIGSAIVNVSSSLDGLLEKYKDDFEFLNEELIAGYTTYEILKVVLNFTKNCGEDFKTQKNGIVPKCLWDHEVNPAMAYYAGFIDGAWESVAIAVDLYQFKEAWDPLSPFFLTSEATEIRKQTVEIILLVKQLEEKDQLASTIKTTFKQEFKKYIDTTIALTPKARYNQGKLIFDVGTMFFGIGELNTLLKTGKVTSTLLTSLKKIPKSFVSFIKSTGKGLKTVIKRIDDVTSAIFVEGQEIARITKEKLIILERAFIQSIDDNLQPVGQLVTPNGLIVQMDDGRTISDRVFDIMKDAQGNYRTAVGKLDDATEKVIGSIVRNGNKVEYTNPAKNILKWTDQHPNSIKQAIKSALESKNVGKLTEGKVGDFINKLGIEIEAFGLKIKNTTTNNLAGDIDVLTKSHIIEIKKTYKSIKEGQLDKFVDRNLDNFLNPFNKRPILYIDELLTASEKA